MHIYLCMHIYVYIHIHTQVDTWICMCRYEYADIRTCMYVRLLKKWAHTVSIHLRTHCCNVLQHAATRCNMLQHSRNLPYTCATAPDIFETTAFRFSARFPYRSVLCVYWVCCSVLQCVTVCCRVLPCVAVCCRVLPCVAGCCTVLQGVAVWFSLSIHCNIPTATHCNTLHRIEARTVCLEFTQHTLLAGELNTIFWQKRGTFDRSKGSFFNRGVLCKKVRIFDRKRGTFGKWALT